MLVSFFLLFTPIWGRFPIWRSYFSDGWFNHQPVVVEETMCFPEYRGNIWWTPQILIRGVFRVFVWQIHDRNLQLFETHTHTLLCLWLWLWLWLLLLLLFLLLFIFVLWQTNQEDLQESLENVLMRLRSETTFSLYRLGHFFGTAAIRWSGEFFLKVGISKAPNCWQS